MIVSYLDKETYKKFYQTKNDAFFHSPEWHDILDNVYDVDMRYLGILKKGEIVAVQPVIAKRVWGLTIFGMPLPQISTPVFPSPLVCTDKVDHSEILVSIDHWVSVKNWKHLQLSWPSGSCHLSHVSEEVRQLVEIDLQCSLLELWSQIKSEARNRIRYAVRNNIKVHLHPSDKFLDEYPRLLEHVYAVSQGIEPNTAPRIFDEVRKRISCLPLKIFTATHKDRVVAMIWIFYDKEACYYWEGAADGTGKRYAANNLLQWEVIRWAHKMGIKRYDMIGGSGRDGSRDGIVRYKLSLGAQVRECQMLYWHKNIIIRLLFLGYRKYQRVICHWRA